MKKIGKITFAALSSSVAVALSLIAVRGVSASQTPLMVSSLRNTAPSAPIVTLVCARFTSNICTDLERVAADGTLTPYAAPPSGSVLVVTDFVWKSASVAPDQVAFATLHHELTSPPHDVAFSSAVATSDAAAVSESHFSTGLLFSDVPVVFVSHTPNVAILHGYLLSQ
jgi:hypothetical protein